MIQTFPAANAEWNVSSVLHDKLEGTRTVGIYHTLSDEIVFHISCFSSGSIEATFHFNDFINIIGEDATLRYRFEGFDKGEVETRTHQDSVYLVSGYYPYIKFMKQFEQALENSSEWLVFSVYDYSYDSHDGEIKFDATTKEKYKKWKNTCENEVQN